MKCSYCDRRTDCKRRSICDGCEDVMSNGIRTRLMDCPGCGKDMAKHGFLYCNGQAYCYDCIRKKNLEICMDCLDLVDAANFVDVGGVMVCKDCASHRGLANCAVCNEFTQMSMVDDSVCTDCCINGIRFAEQRK